MLTADERREIRGALANLPYSGLCTFPTIVTAADVVTSLRRFGKELATVSAGAAADLEELHMFRRQRAVIREFLGTG